ncbi:relaxase/mobilization nuclease domain-containing protein [Chitinophaga oryzae]|uniref:Relaxase/mobilization nuclease domain-containing protein n=1 Tax=Chitinophaga oryzae TaxID=2725414 RepID=A0AAE6ZCX5_9BACT|nr:relaxase/mobilization nuclease domain-containing protein [Chitinophaga oryzae]QJB29900.1 relaxase/mobilization nuclease domain-containing protein [Chitinophaga oryzae]
MVAKITFPGSVLRVLNYNENKVKEGCATLIHAANFLQDKEDMTFYNKLERFQHLHNLREDIRTHTLHISLNFHPTEKFTPDGLTTIADDYMNRIGFSGQPYLIYEHYDAGHPHIHIVTTSIKADGSPIRLHNIGKYKSEPARQAIEIRYGLVHAQGQKELLKGIHPVDVQKIIYGKMETKRSIINVLDAVLKKYKYSSLAELNAVLQLYNVTADRGKEGSRVFQKGGLVYRVVDDKGNKVGVPVKASSIYSNPKLAYLEKRFHDNQSLKEPHAKRVKTAIDWALAGQRQMSIAQLLTTLEKDGISTVRRQNATGQLYGLTFVDHKTKCVFNGSALGKQYSAAGLQQRCAGTTQTPVSQQKVMQPDNLSTGDQVDRDSPVLLNSFKQDKVSTQQVPGLAEPLLASTGIIEQLFQPEYNFQGPEQSRRRRRRKRLLDND